MKTDRTLIQLLINFSLTTMLLASACTSEADRSDGTGGSDSDSESATDSVSDTVSVPDTDADVSNDVDTVSDTEEETAASNLLVLDTIWDLNGVVLTKGMDVTDDGSLLYTWDYNQDVLNAWDGTSLEPFGENDMVTSYGTDLAVDSDGDVYVTKGGTTTGESLVKWDVSTGTWDSVWTQSGLTVTGGLLLGLTTATIAEAQYLYVCNGASDGSQILKLDRLSAASLGAISVADIPLDVAVDAGENHYVLTSTTSNPLTTGDPVFLRKYDAFGVELGTAIQLDGSVYLTLASDNRLYVSCSNFDLPTRVIYILDTDLNLLGEVRLPPEYSGFVGGITSFGVGDEMRIVILGQEGVGSGDICDALVFRVPA